MRKFLIAAAVAALGTTGVQAADIAARPYTKAPPMAPVLSWTGFYAGANIGYGWQDPAVSYTPNDPYSRTFTSGGGLGGTAVPSASYDIKGVLGGVQAGYNWQLDRSWLVGIEADFDGADVKGTGVSNFIFGGIPPTPSTFSATQTVEWFGTLRGRVGWLPSDQLLLFATGGLAYGQVKQNVALQSTNGGGSSGGIGFTCFGVPTCFAGSSSQILTGWTAGAGAEYAVLHNVTLKLEYLYVNLGGAGNVNVVAANPNGFVPSSFTANFSSLNFNVVRVGANYRF